MKEVRVQEKNLCKLLLVVPLLKLTSSLYDFVKFWLQKFCKCFSENTYYERFMIVYAVPIHLQIVQNFISNQSLPFFSYLFPIAV